MMSLNRTSRSETSIYIYICSVVTAGVIKTVNELEDINRSLLL